MHTRTVLHIRGEGSLIGDMMGRMGRGWGFARGAFVAYLPLVDEIFRHF